MIPGTSLEAEEVCGVSNLGIVNCFGLGGVLLAIWLNVRFPRFAPRSLKATMLSLVSGLLVIQLLPDLIPVVVGDGESPRLVAVALFFVFLPLFAYVCLSMIWFMRMVMGMAGLR